MQPAPKAAVELSFFSNEFGRIGQGKYGSTTIFKTRVANLSTRYTNLAAPHRLEKNFSISLEKEIEKLVLNAVLKTSYENSEESAGERA
jgi:hypothetical protein